MLQPDVTASDGPDAGQAGPWCRDYMLNDSASQCFGPPSFVCMPQDATFEMERRRNRPVKYDRTLMHKTVLAMQKVEEVSMNDQAPARIIAMGRIASYPALSSWWAHAASCWGGGVCRSRPCLRP